MKKKMLSAFLCAAMAVTLVAGCGAPAADAGKDKGGDSKHPVSTVQYIQQLRNAKRSRNALLLVFYLTESDLFQADLIFINDPRPCKRFLCVSCIRHKHRRASLCFPLFYFYRLQLSAKFKYHSTTLFSVFIAARSYAS